jgi:hypothetical protein
MLTLRVEPAGQGRGLGRKAQICHVHDLVRRTCVWFPVFMSSATRDSPTFARVASLPLCRQKALQSVDGYLKQKTFADEDIIVRFLVFMDSRA